MPHSLLGNRLRPVASLTFGAQIDSYSARLPVTLREREPDKLGSSLYQTYRDYTPLAAIYTVISIVPKDENLARSYNDWPEVTPIRRKCGYGMNIWFTNWLSIPKES